MFESYYKEEREDRPWYPEREYSEDGGSVGRLEERFLTGRWQRQLGQGKPNLTSLGHRTVQVLAHKMCRVTQGRLTERLTGMMAHSSIGSQHVHTSQGETAWREETNL